MWGRQVWNGTAHGTRAGVVPSAASCPDNASVAKSMLGVADDGGTVRKTHLCMASVGLRKSCALKRATGTPFAATPSGSGGRG